MKTLILSLSFLLCANLHAQSIPEIPIENGIVTYTDVVETELNKSALYANLKTWVALYFVSAKAVTELDDADLGKLILKAKLTPSFSYIGQKRSSDIDIALQVDCKDNKYRYIATVVGYDHRQTPQSIPELIEIAHGRKKTATNNNAYATRQLNRIDESISDMIASLKKNMVVNDDF